jgi:arylsulfatase A
MKIQSQLKKIFILSTILLIAANSWIPLVSAQVVQKPNILFIMLDDIGYHDIAPAPYSSPFVKTPNISILRSQGMAFTNFYTHNVCSETRMSIMTGMNASANGLRANCNTLEGRKGVPEHLTTLPEKLKEGGYRTYHVGKWHIGWADESKPNAVGFDESLMVTARRQYANALLSRNNGPDYLTTTHLTISQGDEVDAQIRRHVATNPSQPFFMNYWASDAHAPHYPIKTWLAQYPDKSEESKYAAIITGFDNQLGRILQTLRDLNIESNTIVIFTSDNGSAMSTHPNLPTGPLRGSKGTSFEGGIKTPLIVRWPGKIQSNSLNNSIVESSDIYPTLAEFAGLSYETGPSRGLSFKSTLLDPSILLGFEREVFREHHTGLKAKKALRKGDWKYVSKGAEDFLFNLASDPYERNNLKVSQPSKLTTMKQRFNDLRLQHAAINLPMVTQPAQSGNVVRFSNQTTPSIEYAHNTLLAPGTHEFTLTMWIKPGAVTSNKMVIAKKGQSYAAELLPDNRVSLSWTELSGEAKSLVSTTRVNPNQWNFIAFTMNRVIVTEAALFVNGNVFASEFDGTMAVTANLMIGKSTGGNNNFVGDLTIPKLFNASLDREEIKRIKLETKPL